MIPEEIGRIAMAMIQPLQRYDKATIRHDMATIRPQYVWPLCSAQLATDGLVKYTSKVIISRLTNY